jgi:hypothetical protein
MFKTIQHFRVNIRFCQMRYIILRNIIPRLSKWTAGLLQHLNSQNRFFPIPVHST